MSEELGLLLIVVRIQCDFMAGRPPGCLHLVALALRACRAWLIAGCHKNIGAPELLDQAL